MKVRINGEEKDFKTVWFEDGVVKLINQPLLPFKFEILDCNGWRETADAITTMVVRGAPAIGATAGYATAQAALQFTGENIDDFYTHIKAASSYIKKARPTAIDLEHAVDRVINAIKGCDKVDECKDKAVREAEKISDDYVDVCKRIGLHGGKLITSGNKILTHCNAGALATVDYGTALAPIRSAHILGKKVFVFADETRPRCQGSRLTAWELAEEKIPHAVIADNAAGYFMQKGEIDLCIVGADRIAANGDVANKIGTYEKAVLAKENNIPFYVAAPKATFDFNCSSGDAIPIEERDEREVTHMWGKGGDIRIASPTSPAKNPAFDVTPAKYVTGYITEIGVLKQDELGKLRQL